MNTALVCLLLLATAFNEDVVKTFKYSVRKRVKEEKEE
jgi:hypothetical protein